MCKVTATEFKENFGKYLSLCATEDIVITKNGKIAGILSNKQKSGWSEFRGILKEENIDLNDTKTAGILKLLWDC